MTFFTHFLVASAGVQALNLTGGDMAMAYGFGLGVDIDHLFKMPLYYKKNKFRNQEHYNWRTSLQEPVALLWIIPLCIYLNTLIPVVFFISHLVMDYSVSYTKRPLFPYLLNKTRGFLPDVSDKLKEIIVFIVFLCINLILISTRA